MKEEKGIALIITLWVLTILSVVAFSFAYLARLEMKISGYERSRLVALGLAQAGIELAIEEIANDLNAYDSFDEEWRQRFVDEEGSLREIEIEDEEGEVVGSYTLRISDEEGKININAGDELSKERMLDELFRLLDLEEHGAIRDSILDWLDPDDLHRIEGAEDSYYESLDPPYECKDGPLDVLGELLMVKGITPELFKEARFPDFLTVYSQGAVNINTAPREVLQAVLGIKESLAQQIVDHREIEPFQNIGEILALPGMTGLPRGTGRRSILGQTAVKSANFTLESRGIIKGGKVERRLVAIVRRGRPATIKYWREE